MWDQLVGIARKELNGAKTLLVFIKKCSGDNVSSGFSVTHPYESTKQ